MQQINDSGRDLFRLDEKEAPNLEQLSRRMRPAEKFLELCAYEGQASLVIDGQTVEASSYPIRMPTEVLMVVSISKHGQQPHPVKPNHIPLPKVLSGSPNFLRW